MLELTAHTEPGRRLVATAQELAADLAHCAEGLVPVMHKHIKAFTDGFLHHGLNSNAGSARFAA